MIKKLRIKFVIVSMLSLLLVLTVIMGAVYFINYKNMVDEADGLLTILLDNDGTFPKPEEDPLSDETGQKDEDGQKGPGQKGSAGEMSPETPYSTRYFSVRLNTEDGTVLSVDTGKIAAIDADAAEAYAAQVWQTRRLRGFSDTYRYGVLENDRETLMVFLDCRQNISTFQSFW